MPFVIAAIGVLAAAYFWMNRARNAAHMAEEVIDMAQTAMGAARRFNFRRQADRHPVECIEDAPIAIGALGVAFLELGNVPTVEDRKTLTTALRIKIRASEEDAEEYLVLGKWLVDQCNGAAPAWTRLSRRLRKLAGPQGLDQLMPVITHVIENGVSHQTMRQREALAELERIFRS